jgi:hypothetical protein
MFGYIYQLFLVWDALRLKNTIQVIGLVLYNIGILVYAAIQFDQIKDAANDLNKEKFIPPDFWNEVKPMLIALPVLMAVATLMFAFEAWKLYDEFAWTIYKRISADTRLKKRYLTYQVPFSHHPDVPHPDHDVDLHRTSEVRLLLLPGLHRTVPSRREEHQDGRTGADRRRPCHHLLPALPRWLVGSSRVLRRHDWHYRCLLHCYGLLPVQAHPDVRCRRKTPRGLQARPQVVDRLRHPHHSATRLHHHHSMPVHAQLQQGPQATRQRQSRTERQGIQHRDAIIERTNTITTDGN